MSLQCVVVITSRFVEVHSVMFGTMIKSPKYALFGLLPCLGEPCLWDMYLNCQQDKYRKRILKQLFP